MEGLKTGKNAPPSPAPSHHDLPHGLNELLMHNSTNPSYHHEQAGASHIKYQPGSRQTTPVAQQVTYQSFDPGMPYQQGYSQHRVYGHEDSPYGPLPDEAERNTYSTPATSPPTPSRGSDVIATRSGAPAARNSRPLAPKSTRVEKTTPKKKDKKAKKKVIEIDRPLSQIIRELALDIFDIEKFVNRPDKERHDETEVGKNPGKIKRPMNAFMLYRKAYQDSAKLHWKHHNHQVISQVCGDSWNMETEDVRSQFNEWARLERDNHQKAHPGYKFTPSKAIKPNGRSSKERELGEDESELEDFDWNTTRSRAARKGLDDPDGDYQPPRSLQYGHNPAYPTMSSIRGQLGVSHPPNPSRFEYSNPNKLPPTPYDHHSIRGQYYETTQMQPPHNHQLPGGVEDLVMRKTSSPGMGAPAGMPYQHHPPQQHHSMHYDLMKPYGSQQLLHHQHHHHHQQLPQQNHREHQPGRVPPHLEQRIDPLLQEGPSGPLFDPGFGNPMFIDGGLNVQQWHAPPLGDVATDQQYTGAFAGLDETLLQDQQQTQLLRGGENDWHVETLEGGQFDTAWAETPPHGES
ncbi:hypothetical protein GQ53DRAFT_825408 [Thozetella sp. PMI_491]|nr:hypothetical protein GQ53DRAFT_825408 [Thozetella sp. PMI_491]